MSVKKFISTTAILLTKSKKQPITNIKIIRVDLWDSCLKYSTLFFELYQTVKVIKNYNFFEVLKWNSLL